MPEKKTVESKQQRLEATKRLECFPRLRTMHLPAQGEYITGRAQEPGLHPCIEDDSIWL